MDRNLDACVAKLLLNRQILQVVRLCQQPSHGLARRLFAKVASIDVNLLDGVLVRRVVAGVEHPGQVPPLQPVVTQEENLKASLPADVLSYEINCVVVIEPVFVLA